MPDRFVIDTNIFILLFNDRLAEPLPAGELSCSVITEMELLSFPQLTRSEEALIRERLAELAVYTIDEHVKAEAIRLRRARLLKLPDAIVAATALVHDAQLITNDQRFQNVPNLNCRELTLKS